MLVAILLAAAQPQWNCDDPQVQQEMNWCAAKSYEAADAALNRQWPRTVAAMKERDARLDRAYDDRPGYFETLLEAQRAWLKYRDAHCASEGFWARGGSLEPLLVATCKRKLTEERTQQLQYLVEQ